MAWLLIASKPDAQSRSSQATYPAYAIYIYLVPPPYLQAVLVAMEKENDELRAKTMAGTDEMTTLQSENEQLRDEKAKMEREFWKIKREVITHYYKNGSSAIGTLILAFF